MSKYRYNVQFESSPVMKSSHDGRTTLSETVYCDRLDTVVIDDEPRYLEFYDEENAPVFTVHYDKFVSAERVSGNDNDD